MKHKCDGCKHKGEHQEMGFKPFGVCLKETNLLAADKSYNADKCPFKKTNFDRLKAMSIEEMAEFLDDIQTDALFLEGTIHDLKYPTEWKKYLESEVQEE